ncbi:MAG: hypothetical protein ABFS45_23715 [Pseudomonadota bacterium]
MTARRALMQLVRVARPDEGREDMRRWIKLEEMGEEVREVVRRLAEACLLVTGGKAPKEGEQPGSPVIEDPVDENIDQPSGGLFAGVLIGDRFNTFNPIEPMRVIRVVIRQE